MGHTRRVEQGKDRVEQGRDLGKPDEAPVPTPDTTGEAANTPKPSRRTAYARAVRRLASRRTLVALLRAVAAWTRRPAARLVLPGLLLVALMALAGTAGAILVPAAARPLANAGGAAPTPEVDTVDPSAAPGAPDPLGSGQPSAPAGVPPGAPGTAQPGVATPGGPATGQPATGRPSDALADWARQAGAKVGIPATAMQAYGYAEVVLARTTPACQLRWTTLAAIGKVESGHGSANSAVLGADGQAQPPIIGLPLDGQGGRMMIADTDRGQLDGDQRYDRAIGPMQFIPTTWAEIGADADNNGVKDPNDLDDAALAAGNYLCKGGRNLSAAEDWWNAILSYNDVRRYAQDVFSSANDYGVRSRT